VLRGIALHKVPLAEADRWLDHFSSCSPCFQEFSQFRKQALDRRRRTQVWLAAAAILLFAVAGWLWIRTRPSAQTTAIVVLDLRERSVVRGENPVEAGQHPLEIPRGTRHMVMDLPIGSKEGRYHVALLGEAGDEILGTTGTAQLESHVVVLRADLDLSGVRAGSYFLGLRQSGLEWTQFPVRMR